MRILFIAPDYLNLYKIVKNELENQGHIVTYIKQQHFDSPYFTWVGHKWLRKFVYERFGNEMDDYWKQKIKEGCLSSSYDHCIIINGEDCTRRLLSFLRK